LLMTLSTIMAKIFKKFLDLFLVVSKGKLV